MSAVVMIFHLFFTCLINFKIKPYQNSLKIHRKVLLMQHIIFLIFLSLINLINYLPKLD
jgi:hypothetical protein